MKKIDGWGYNAAGAFLAARCLKPVLKPAATHDVAVYFTAQCRQQPGARVYAEIKMCAAPVLVSRKVAAKILCAGYCGKQRLR